MLLGKVAVVSGGARGIGKAIVLELAKLGADVAFNYLASREDADILCHEVEQIGRRCIPYQVDIREYDDVKEMVANISEKLGSIDIVINNAGIIADGALATMSNDMWHNVINTSLNGTFNLTKSTIVSMMKKKTGTIVNIASVSGVVGMSRQTNYSAAKAGIIGFTKALAKEVAAYGIRVNAIAPGFIDTEMVSEDVFSGHRDKIASKRIGQAQEVAELVAFLCSEKSKYLIGDVIRIDGGLTV